MDAQAARVKRHPSGVFAVVALAVTYLAFGISPGKASDLGTPVKPLFFHWVDPEPGRELGRLVHDHVALVRENVGERFFFVAPPEIIADKVVDQILSKGLGKEGIPVAIVLQSFGMEGDWKLDLLTDPRDGYRYMFADKVVEEDRTIFMRHGVEAARQWMQKFIARYKFRQNPEHRNAFVVPRSAGVPWFDPAIDVLPDPHRFHFDAERKPNTADVILFHRLLHHDPRADAESIFGFEGRTLRELYIDYLADFRGAPGAPYATYLAWPEGANRRFHDWYRSAVLQASEGAMDKAAYELIRQAWPDANGPGIPTSVSNFATSAHYDGQEGRFLNSESWSEVSWTPRADLMAPVFYSPSSVRANEEGYEHREDWYRSNLKARTESMIGSAGGSDSLTPWIQLPWIRDEDGAPTRDMVHSALSVLKARKVTEMLVFEHKGYGAAHWDLFHQIIRQVYDDVVPVQVVGHYLGSGDRLEEMRYWLGDAADWGPANGTGEVTVAYEYTTNLSHQDPPDMLRLDIVFATSDAATLPVFQVMMHDFQTDVMEPVTAAIPTAAGVNALTVDIRHEPDGIDLGRYINPVDGSMHATMRWRGEPAPYTVSVDLVQLVPKDEREPYVSQRGPISASISTGRLADPEGEFFADLENSEVSPAVLSKFVFRKQMETMKIEDVAFADPRDHDNVPTNVRFTITGKIMNFDPVMDEILMSVSVFNHSLDEDDMPIGYQKRYETAWMSDVNAPLTATRSFEHYLYEDDVDPLTDEILYMITFTDPRNHEGNSFSFLTEIERIAIMTQEMPNPYVNEADLLEAEPSGWTDRMLRYVKVPEPDVLGLMTGGVFFLLGRRRSC